MESGDLKNTSDNEAKRTTHNEDALAVRQGSSILNEWNLGSPSWIWIYFVATICVITRFFFNDLKPGLMHLTHIGTLLSFPIIVANRMCFAKHWSRIPIAFCGICILGFFMGLTTSPRNVFDWMGFLICFLIAIPIILTLESIKLFLGRFQKLGDADAEEYVEGIQFNIRHLLILTFCVAVPCGLWNLFSESLTAYFSGSLPQSVIVFLLLMSLTMATFTLLSIWTLLGKWRIWRLVVTILVGTSACAISVYFSQAPRSRYLDLAVHNLLARCICLAVPDSTRRFPIRS